MRVANISVTPEDEWVILRYIYEQMEAHTGTGVHFLEHLCGMDRATAWKVCEAWRSGIDTPKILTDAGRGLEWVSR
ncbi:MAG: hypothetical protein CL484_10045 [Acidobacteria bacterium]|nr:hypothetical protein [Acidobacteriota bacterium]